MAQNPLNLAFRFALEMAALYFLGYWGWTRHEGVWRYLLAFGLPLLAAVVWGTFHVPDDGGAPRVRVSGAVRLLIEVLFSGLPYGGRLTQAQPRPSGDQAKLHILLSRMGSIFLGSCVFRSQTITVPSPDPEASYPSDDQATLVAAFSYPSSFCAGSPCFHRSGVLSGFGCLLPSGGNLASLDSDQTPVSA